MKTYIYPSDLKVKATVWLWTLRDLAVLLGIAVLGVIALVNLRTTLVLAITIAYGIATARFEGNSIADYTVIAFRYFVGIPQTYLWRFRYEQKNKE